MAALVGVLLLLSAIRFSLVPAWRFWARSHLYEGDRDFGEQTWAFLEGRRTQSPTRRATIITPAEIRHLRGLRGLAEAFLHPVVTVVLLGVTAGVLLGPFARVRSERLARVRLGAVVVATALVVIVAVAFGAVFDAFHVIVLPPSLRGLSPASTTYRTFSPDFFHWFAVRLAIGAGSVVSIATLWAAARRRRSRIRSGRTTVADES